MKRHRLRCHRLHCLLLCSVPAVSVHRKTRWLRLTMNKKFDAKTLGFLIYSRPIRVEIWHLCWGNHFTIIHKTTIRRRLLRPIPRARARAASSSAHLAVSAAALSGSAHPMACAAVSSARPMVCAAMCLAKTVIDLSWRGEQRSIHYQYLKRKEQPLRLSLSQHFKCTQHVRTLPPTAALTRAQKMNLTPLRTRLNMKTKNYLALPLKSHTSSSTPAPLLTWQIKI